MKFFTISLLLIFISCNSKKSIDTGSRPIDTVVKNSAERQLKDCVIISERIDGPANIRDTINGDLLYSLNDKVAVTTTDTANKWLQVGVIIDVTKEQMDKLMITKGSKLYVDGKEIGHTIKDVPLQGAFETERKLKGELVGYTSISNIRANTFPENAFMEIINSNGNSLATNQFQKFFKNFEFRSFDSLMPHFKAYEIDENWIDDPSPLLRLWILFKDDKFYGVFHSRHLPLDNARVYKTKRRFYFSTFSDDVTTNKNLVDAFNSFIVQVD
jgi:hypothetical protein